MKPHPLHLFLVSVSIGGVGNMHNTISNAPEQGALALLSLTTLTMWKCPKCPTNALLCVALALVEVSAPSARLESKQRTCIRSRSLWPAQMEASLYWKSQPWKTLFSPTRHWNSSISDLKSWRTKCRRQWGRSPRTLISVAVTVQKLLSS